jgi:hypothetical protein
LPIPVMPRRGSKPREACLSASTFQGHIPNHLFLSGGCAQRGADDVFRETGVKTGMNARGFKGQDLEHDREHPALHAFQGLLDLVRGTHVRWLLTTHSMASRDTP